MQQFGHILNWRLLAGSHDFPGKDGGTCINEAAALAAGYKYCRISKLGDCPPCFSWAIARYTITLNDSMNDEDRQKLLPFVARLAGTRDLDRDCARGRYIIDQTIKRIYPLRNPAFRAGFDVSIEAAAFVVGERYWDRTEEAHKKIVATALEILDEAIMMGNHASDIDMALINRRLADAKAFA
jgi:hypothetical protein